MIENHELYNQIPKPVQKWTSEDVKKWFSLNKIKVSSNLKIDGENFKKLTPTKLIKQCQIQSHFLIRKITDWLQFQVSDFNQYVQQVKNQNQQSLQEKKEVKQQKVQQTEIIEAQYKNEQKDKVVAFTILNKQLQSEITQQQKEKSSSNIQRQQLLQKKENKDHLNQQDISPIKIENQICEIYKPMKYKASKNLKKKKQQIQYKKLQQSQSDNNQKDHSPEPQKMFFKDNKHSKINKKMLKLNDLEQNFQSNQDIPTQKHIPDAESQNQQSQWQSYFRQYKSQFVKKQQNYDSKKIKQKVSPLSQNPNIKFISSQYFIPQIHSLFLHFDKQIHKIHQNGITKIGRSNVNDIVLAKDSISRLHAQVVVQQQEEQGQKLKKYYLKDIGSKFGTFVEIDPERPKQVNEGDVYCIGSTLIQVIKANVSKNKQKFDLNVNEIFQQNKKSFIFYSKNQVSVGKKLRQSTSKDTQKNNHSQPTKRLKEKIEVDTKDIQLEGANVYGYHCRFVILNQQIYLEQVQGNIFQKLQKNQMKPLQRLNTLIKLGQEDAIIQKENTYKMMQS